MAYNNGFPMGYQQGYYPGYNPGYVPYNQPSQVQQQNVQQMMTPPTIRAEIIQVDNEDAANNYPVGAGQSQMMIAKDDSAIFVKTATPNGQCTLDVFVKRPPTPQAPAFDPSQYLRKDELPDAINEFFSSERKAKKGAEE